MAEAYLAFVVKRVNRGRGGRRRGRVGHGHVGLPKRPACAAWRLANHAVGKGERYYQQIAVNRVVEAILTGRRRLLVTMATGAGKTAVAFQICWKLWTSCWNRTGEHRRPRILYLADRNILIDQPKDGLFAEFGDA